MEILVSLCIGITLSAACGFRIFVPPLIMSVGAIYFDLPVGNQFAWVATYPAMITFAIATFVEIVAYYIPVIDNLLDTIEIPTALAVGTMLTAASLGEMDPVLKWAIALIAGGGVAGMTESLTTLTRATSTAFTAGMGNPIVSTMEALSSLILSILALFAPILAGIIVIIVLIFALKKIMKFLRHQWHKKDL
jgi:uncharacterized membrane protein